jgi:protein dithiol oxidoreductase (disulfide-forming)
MNKWRRAWIGSVTVLLAGVAAAAAPVVLVEGQNFRTLATPIGTDSGDKVEVLEAFSYGCVHCFEFEPALRAWKAQLPADVQVAYLPATFNSTFELYARGYYAAKTLGLADALHDKVFDSIWKSGLQAQDAGQLTNLYVRLGADRAKFSEALASPGVQAAISAATAKAERLKLEGTPTLYVDGRYQVLTTGATSYDDIMQRLDAVIARARADHNKKGKT